MLFRDKFDRARKTQRYNAGLDEDLGVDVREKEEKVPLEKGDAFAMLLAAFLTIFLPAIGVLGLLVLVGCLFFRVF
jgi:hypothetical protein